MSRDRDDDDDRDLDRDRPETSCPEGKVLDFVHKRTYNCAQDEQRADQQRYEWDPEKARTNLAKHKVDFADAALVLEDPLALTMPDPCAFGEARQLALGRDAYDRLLAVLFVWREPRARLISARRATTHERLRYEGEP